MDITVIIPIFNLVSERYKNFDFVVRQLLKTPSVKEIIVVEQKDSDFSIVSQLFNDEKYNHQLFITDNEELEKTKMINYGVSMVKTDFFCMIDADILFDFETAFSQIKKKDKAVMPFEYFLKLDKDESAKMFKDPTIKIEGNYKNTIRCFSAGSFIMKKSFYEEIGGMNEAYIGYGWEDREFQDVTRNNTEIRYIDLVGYHLYHEPSKSKKASANYLTYYKHLCKNIDTAVVCVVDEVTDATIKAIKHDKKQSLPVQRVWVELLYDDEKSKLEGVLDKKTQHIVVRGNENNKGLCQREAMMNIAVSQLDKKFRYIIFKDSKVYTEDGDWYIKMRNRLTSGENVIIQGGIKTTYMNNKLNTPHSEMKTLWASYKRGFPESDFNFGLCIGMNRIFWEKMDGFNPYGTMMYGDMLFALEIFSKSIHQKYKYLKENKFIGDIVRKLEVKVEFDGTNHNILQEYEGKQTNFDTIYKFLNNIDENIKDYIELGENGLLYWKKDFTLFKYLYDNLNHIRNDDDLIKTMIASTLQDYK